MSGVNFRAHPDFAGELWTPVAQVTSNPSFWAVCIASSWCSIRAPPLRVIDSCFSRLFWVVVTLHHSPCCRPTFVGLAMAPCCRHRLCFVGTVWELYFFGSSWAGKVFPGFGWCWVRCPSWCRRQRGPVGLGVVVHSALWFWGVLCLRLEELAASCTV